jgi:hypothetical protein
MCKWPEIKRDHKNETTLYYWPKNFAKREGKSKARKIN